MYQIHTYDKQEIKQQKYQFTKEVLQEDYKLWIDLEDPTFEEMSKIGEIFNIDKKILKQYFNGSTKSQLRFLENYSFAIVLNIEIIPFQTIETEPVYLLNNNNWLITIHSSKINLTERMHEIFKIDNTIYEFSLDTLYYSIISTIVEDYNHLLNTIELAMINFQGESLYNSSKEISAKIKNLSQNILNLRDELLKVRAILNLLINKTETTKKKEDLIFLQRISNRVKELLELNEIHKKSLNSIGELYNSYILFYKLI
jgi:magnesium transporter